MSRFRITDSLLIACVVTLLAMPAVALADVLEISASGSVWIAGGPVAPAAFQPTESHAQQGASGDLKADDNAPAPAQQQFAITHVADTAGPAQWRVRVAELAAKYDISPALLEALVWQESRWKPGAVSPVGALGLAQLMPGTARNLGVDPRDPSANLEGGARYLRTQLDTFGGNLEKALAAYNAGPGRVMRAGGIPRIRETQNYVSAILSRLSQPVRR